jgi:RPA family protein
MSESEQSGAGRREVAYRLFAAEFDDSDFSYSESDEERAPNYVITPTGARVNRLFVVGVLTEVEQVSEDVLRARVVDPTGAFVLYAGQYQPDEQAFLDSAETPMFVALTGKARTFQPDDSNQVFTSVRPESISEVDATTRDRWTVQTAEQTIDRVGHMATALSLDVRGDDLRATLEDNGVDDGLAAGIPLAIEHYGTTGAYLSALRDLSVDAACLVAGELDEVEGLSLDPDQGDDGDLKSLADADIDVSVSADDVAGAAAEPSVDDATPSEPETVDTSTAESDTEPTDTTAEVTTTTTDAVSETAETDTTETASEDDATAADTTTEGDVTAEAPTTESATDTTTETAESEPVETDTTEAAAAATPGASETGDQDTDTVDSGAQTAASSDDADAGADTEGDDIGDFEPGEFELDEDEREEIEEEYGTEFQSGSDVPDPGESDIETPDPEELAEAEPDGKPVDSEPEPEPEAAEASDGETDDADDAAAQSAEDIDLGEVTIEVMGELDNGDGADRETLVETLVDRYGVSADDVEDAIQDALMDGRCYEPDDTTVKPI